MEKSSRSSKAINILNFLPTHSSSNDNHTKRRMTQTTSFSGPLVSIVPLEARRRNRNGSGRGFETPKEPTSPKVSCIGQIKLRKNSLRNRSQRKNSTNNLDRQVPAKKHARTFSLRKIFQRKVKPSGHTSSTAVESADSKNGDTERKAPSLGEMRRFVSGRESLGDFDWRNVRVRSRNVERGDEWFSDEEEGIHDYGDDDDDVIVPHSAPIVIGGGVVAPEPKKEVNIWRRRTMVQPSALSLS